MRSLAGALVLTLAALPALAQTRPVTIDDVLAMKTVGGPAVSPDGTSITIRRIG